MQGVVKFLITSVKICWGKNKRKLEQFNNLHRHYIILTRRTTTLDDISGNAVKEFFPLVMQLHRDSCLGIRIVDIFDPLRKCLTESRLIISYIAVAALDVFSI